MVSTRLPLIRPLALGTLVLALTAPGLSAAESEPVDYADQANWLCLPDRDDACSGDLSTSIVAPSGAIVTETFAPHADPPIDCFYVYPTVSNDRGGNSDLDPGPEERGVVHAQFARFASQCRPYAPLYRQITLTALLARMQGGEIESDRAMAYGDVVAAWKHYLAHHNQGRGVILVGHSQGSGMLRQLLLDEFQGKPTMQRLVSAMLIGTNVLVAEGSDRGGTFSDIPLCRSPTQTGCVVSYVTFRNTVPAPERSLFGRSRQPGQAVACTNPGALNGGAVTLRPYINSEGVRQQSVDWATGAEIETAFVTLPGLLTGECVVRDAANVLEVTVNADPSDARADDVPGDVVIGDRVSAEWGLHLVDMHVAMGDLVELAGRQAAAFLAGEQ